MSGSDLGRAAPRREGSRLSVEDAYCPTWSLRNLQYCVISPTPILLRAWSAMSGTDMQTSYAIARQCVVLGYSRLPILLGGCYAMCGAAVLICGG
eukprot:222702-Rhodomonas_salina.2